VSGDRSSGRRLLVVSYHAPGTELPPARRVAAIAAELEARGVEVDVLTTAYFGRNGSSAVAAPDLRTLLARSRTHPVGDAPAPAFRRGRLSRVVPPDVTAATWLPAALPRALALQRRHRYVAVLTTSPPESAHLVGAALRARGARWIADLRDGWTFESPVARSYWHGFEERLERRVLGRADALVAATEPIAADLRERIPGAHVVHLENVFDPATPAEEPPLKLDPSRFSLVYTGTGAADGKDPRPFLDALARLLARRPELADRIEVVFAGSFQPEELAAIAATQLRGTARFAGRLPYPQALGLQRAADGLLLVLPPGTIGVTTGKVFEYLAARKPILTVGSGAGADLVSSAGPHSVASAPERLADDVEAYFDRWLGGAAFEPVPGFDPGRFSPAHSAEELLDLLERLDG
jgi:glycosyltransferase involved in cell wall biosynthesis